MYHHKHQAACVAVINYPAGQDRLIRSWFGGRTRLVNNDKWRHVPSYIILSFCLIPGNPFIFRKSSIFLFSSRASLPSVLICNKRLLHIQAYVHAEASGVARYNYNSCNCKLKSAQRHVDGSSAARADSFLVHFPQVDYLSMSRLSNEFII